MYELRRHTSGWLWRLFLLLTKTPLFFRIPFVCASLGTGTEKNDIHPPRLYCLAITPRAEATPTGAR